MFFFCTTKFFQKDNPAGTKWLSVEKYISNLPVKNICKVCLKPFFNANYGLWRSSLKNHNEFYSEVNINLTASFVRITWLSTGPLTERRVEKRLSFVNMFEIEKNARGHWKNGKCFNEIISFLWYVFLWMNSKHKVKHSKRC